MPAAKWEFDTAHANIGFTVRHMMVAKVHGRFAKWEGSFTFDDANPAAAKAEVTIDVASIDTNEAQRDAHLRSPDFFDAEHFPAMTFRSTKIERVNGADFKVLGDLTIRGVTRAVVLDAEYAGKVTDLQGNARAGFSAKTFIDRKDFGLTWNMLLEAGGFAVADKVDITIEFEAVRQKAEAVPAGDGKAVA
jgi:polyisoprenoid-binding protein YceI